MIFKFKLFFSKVKVRVMWRRQLYVVEVNIRRQYYLQFNEIEQRGDRGGTEDIWLKGNVDFFMLFGNNCKYVISIFVMYCFYYFSGILLLIFGICSIVVLYI